MSLPSIMSWGSGMSADCTLLKLVKDSYLPPLVLRTKYLLKYVSYFSPIEQNVKTGGFFTKISGTFSFKQF